MGFISHIFHKLNSGFYYVVDADIFFQYLERSFAFSLENQLEASANLYLYLGSGKHHIQIWNYQASTDVKEQAKGVIFSFDKEEYSSLSSLIQSRLSSLPSYFKIELIDADDVFLNDYKKNHPELTIENY